jgi:pimeloyl-ACP methyl ester carboxylesterase
MAGSLASAHEAHEANEGLDISDIAHGLRAQWRVARAVARAGSLLVMPSTLGGRVTAQIGHLSPTTWTLPEWAASVANGFVIHHDVHPEGEGRMSVRRNGHRVPVSRRELAAAYPAATSRLVVMVHGLADTEAAWFHRDEPQRRRTGTDFGRRLTGDLPCTAVYVRYDTGRHVSDNGTELVRLLSDLVEHWPRTVREIVLIGHSLGGLVVRSAIHQARYRKLPWLSQVTGVVCLGTPHAGAPLERAAAWTAAQLGKLPMTAPLSRLLDLRSGAIKDLAHGYLHEYQWSTEVARLSPEERAKLASFPAAVPQLFIYATVSRSETRWGRFLGDLVVSAANAGTPDYDADLRWLGGLNHIDLLHHDTVYEAVLDWLRTRPRRPAPPASAHNQRARLTRSPRPKRAVQSPRARQGSTHRVSGVPQG